MDKQWLIDFWDAYDECAKRGMADSPGGAEFHRVLVTALDLYPEPLDPKDFTSFIERGANALPR
jgi:hypothetical protein